MKAVVIDDEQPALDELKFFLLKYHIDVLGAFVDPLDGFEFIKHEKPDIVILDIDMPGMNGIELGIRIQEIYPSVIIVFVTAYPQYSLAAYKAHPFDYIVKPIDEEQFAKTMRSIERRKSTPLVEKQTNTRIYCFGDFSVIGNAPVRFPYQKSRELLAYIICNWDRMIYRDEMISALFGTQDLKKASNYLRVTLYRLRSALTTYNVGKDEVLINEDLTIEIKDGVCDYVDFCRYFVRKKIIDSSNVSEAEQIISLYRGDFLRDLDYPWVEEKRQWASISVEELIIKTSAYFLARGQDKSTEALLQRLVEINPFSEQGYSHLLDIYMRRGDRINFNYYFSLYRNVMKELREPIGRKYSAFFESESLL